jgi:hypothetical protein
MNMQQTCDPDRLDAFVRGELSEQQESELTAHLDQCETCGEELERRVAAADQWQEAGELLTHRTRRSNVVDLANDPSTNASSATSTTFAEQMDQVIGMLAPTESLQANRLKAKQQRIPPIAKYIAVAAGAFALFFAGILIVLELDKGTLTIESELDDVPIRIMQGEDVVKSLTVSKQGATTRIGAGRYIVEIGQEFDKAVIKDGGVELSRGATAIVKVTQTNANTAEDEKAKDEAAKAWQRRPVVGSFHDGKSFQLAGHDALMHCVMTNNSEALNRLLTMDKYDLDFSPGNGQWTLLQTALQRSCLETTSLLLQHGANPNFASKGTPLPLELAKRSGRKVLVALVQKYLESNAPNSQTNVDVHAAELQGNRQLVYQPLDGALETSEVGYSLSIGEQTLTLAGHSHPCKLLPENTILWNYPPEYSGKIGARHMTDARPPSCWHRCPPTEACCPNPS